jgi:hypothetical protein
MIFDKRVIQYNPDFDYQRESKAINHKDQIAKALLQIPATTGNTVINGRLMPTSNLQALLSIGARIAGGYLMANSMSEQDQLDKASRMAYSAGIDMLKNEGVDETAAKQAAKQAITDQVGFTHKNPELVGPQPEDTPVPNNNVAQTSPVPEQRVIQGQPLAPVQPKQRVLKRATNVAPAAPAAKPDFVDAKTAEYQATGYPSDVMSNYAPLQNTPIYSSNPTTETDAGGNTYTDPNYTRTALGRDDIGVNRQTNQQMESAWKGLKSAGGGRGVQGGPTAEEMPNPTYAAGVDASRGQVDMNQLQAPSFGPDYQAPTADANPNTGLFNFDENAAKADVAAKLGVLQKAKAARMLQARDALYNSGERGQRIATAIDDAEIKNMFNPKQTDIIAVKPGESLYDKNSGQFVQVPGGSNRNKEVSTTKDTPEGLLIVYKDGSTELRKDVMTKESAAAKEEVDSKKAMVQSGIDIKNRLIGTVDAIIGSGKLSDAGAGMGNKLSAAGNQYLGFATDTADIRSQIDALRNQFLPNIMAEMTAKGISPTALLNTEVEAKRAIDATSNLDYTRLTGNQLKAVLLELRTRLSSALDKDMASIGGAGGVNTQNGAIVGPSGRQWIRK